MNSLRSQEQLDAKNYADIGFEKLVEYLKSRFDLTEIQTHYLAGKLVRELPINIEQEHSLFKQVNHAANKTRKLHQ